MDILSVLSEQTTSVALALTIMWFYNKMVLDFLSERKELIEELRQERQEWLNQSQNNINRLFEIEHRNTDALTAMRIEVHNLKGEIQKFIFDSARKEVAKGDK